MGFNESEKSSECSGNELSDSRKIALAPKANYANFNFARYVGALIWRLQDRMPRAPKTGRLSQWHRSYRSVELSRLALSRMPEGPPGNHDDLFVAQR